MFKTKISVKLLHCRLILDATLPILAPFETSQCRPEICYVLCDNIWSGPRFTDDRETIEIRAIYINLKDLSDQVQPNTKRVYLYAQKVMIDEDVTFPFSLMVKAHEIIIDRSKSYYIRVSRDTPVLVDDYFTTNDQAPVWETLFMKQSYSCARILVDNYLSNTNNQEYLTTAMEMMNTLI